MGMQTVNMHTACDAFLPDPHRLRGLTTKQLINELAKLVNYSEGDKRASAGARQEEGFGAGPLQGTTGVWSLKRTLLGSERGDDKKTSLRVLPSRIDARRTSRNRAEGYLEGSIRIISFQIMHCR